MSVEQDDKPLSKSQKFVDKVEKDLSPWGIDLQALGIKYKLDDFLSQDKNLTDKIMQEYAKLDSSRKTLYGKEINDKEREKIKRFTKAFVQYLQTNRPPTKESFKNFMIHYLKKNPSDYKAVVAGIRIVSHSADMKSLAASIKNWSLTIKDLFNEVLNELLKPSKARSTLYNIIGIEYERMGYDRKLGQNEQYQIIMKGVIDEMMSIGPVIEYFTEEPLACTKAFIDMMRPLDSFIETLEGMLKSYTKMFEVDETTPKGQYEIGKGMTQWIIGILGGVSGVFKNIATKIGVGAAMTGPGMRAEAE